MNVPIVSGIEAAEEGKEEGQGCWKCTSIKFARK